MFDILIILIVMSICIISYKKGIISMLIFLLKDILAFILTKFFYDTIISFFKIDLFVTEIVSKNINPLIKSLSYNELESLVNKFAIVSKDMKEFLYKSNIIVNDNYSIEQISNTITNIISQWISMVLCMIIVFFVISILLSLAMQVLKLLSKIPIIKGFNSILGFILGVFISHFVVVILISLFILFIPISKQIQSYEKEFYKSKIVNYYIENKFTFVNYVK